MDEHDEQFGQFKYDHRQLSNGSLCDLMAEEGVYAFAHGEVPKVNPEADPDQYLVVTRSLITGQVTLSLGEDYRDALLSALSSTLNMKKEKDHYARSYD